MIEEPVVKDSQPELFGAENRSEDKKGAHHKSKGAPEYIGVASPFHGDKKVEDAVKQAEQADPIGKLTYQLTNFLTYQFINILLYYIASLIKLLFTKYRLLSHQLALTSTCLIRH